MYQGKIHIHIQNSDISHPVFVGTKQHVEDLLKRNPDLADKLYFTIGSSDYDEVDRWSQEDFDEYYSCMKTADIMVGFSFPTENLRQYAPCLRWIHFISSGVDHLAPFTWVPDDIKLINNRGVHLPKSGESFAMFLAMLNAHIPSLVTSQRRHKWDKDFTSVIKGKTLCIIGVGHQGGEMARKAKELGLNVIGIDPYIKEHPYCEMVVDNSRMEEVLGKADFLAIAAPLTDETRGIVSGEVLGWLPPHAGVINVSRGPLLDEEALSRKLYAGELSGAILDVFQQEPLPENSPLWDTPNLIMTPHVSSDDLVYYMPLTLDLVIHNLRNEMEGKPFINVVNANKAF
ncbi:D-2-hydroxyacid dehydrogenase [Clostridium sp. chh4-2]|uniref:D-2-hydroxyacid dehydrogenase n=1 Tax=Clostridium sp. chh4-2 TaxID=2067550 RepID=UPI000CCF9E9A|nr:D-2-hydroxyacid dehydrogenase [Clostridium sp. chh4-2]PNV60889.1 D-2-hydroxyacid dehydrogenase [Clostridium sp. chh4-2]